MKPRIVQRGDLLFTLKDWPNRVPNPSKWKVAVYRDGALIGAARKIADAEERISRGYYDEDAAKVDEAEPVCQ